MTIRGLENYSKAANPSHFDIERVIRTNILTLEPYRCARDDYQSGILLDANENALGHSIDISASSSSALESYTTMDLHRYPDPAQVEIKRRIAELRRVPGPDHVFLGVGSDEVIDLLMRVCCTPGVDKIITTPPTYGMYAVCAQVNDVPIVKVPLETRGGVFQLKVDEVKRTVAADPSIKLIFLCSPGNPTGTLIPVSDIQEILVDPAFKGIVVVDEAYIDFAGANASAASLVHEFTNICVMQTLSKGFGLAAIRLGIALAQPPLIQILTNTKAPYNISTPTSALALQALSPASLKAMEAKVDSLVNGRTKLMAKLKPLRKYGLAEPLGGNHANFILVPVLDGEGGKPDNKRAHKLYEELAENNGVVIRYRGSQLGCDGCLRMTVGSDEEIEVLAQKLEEVLQKF